MWSIVELLLTSYAVAEFFDSMVSPMRIRMQGVSEMPLPRWPQTGVLDAPSRALEQWVARNATDHVSVSSPPDCGQSPHSPPRSHPHAPCGPTLLPRLEQTTNCAPNTHPALPTRREDGRWKLGPAWPRTCARARKIGVQTHLTVSTRPIHRPQPPGSHRQRTHGRRDASPSSAALRASRSKKRRTTLAFSPARHT